MVNVEKLEKLGFTTATNKIKEIKDLNRKMVVAYEHFRYVTPDRIDIFNENLKRETLREDKSAYHYKQLIFVSLADYPKVPPMEVLDKIEQAQELKCFDYFEIAKIEAITEQKDPIIFGRINKCPDRFFIAQWDNDVKIDQIISNNEG